MELNYEKLVKLRETRPFPPIAINLKSGERYEVDDWARYSLNDHRVVLITRGGVRFFDLEQVRSVDLVPQPY